ncbi:MFS transporter [Microseira wollei]|uniref:EmrB/QacA subfamily drug resistance transporter n=1 Tax=Microseira wollei NIES-4236 TaxID=2530354 RepID=A0AAV3X7J0_9CYAN|nr:MFS transporter [Microseira wollei]GET36615.1 EmrB/QacA subfamily drug resistance transporter [Microseira wollei NIES-4236]
MNATEEKSNNLTQELTESPKWWAMLGIGMGVFMFALDVHIVNLALPTLVQSFHTSFATIQWVPLSYLLMSTVFVLGAARLGDMWSKKWLYLGGLMAFTISSLLCGLAPTVGFLIGFRALQGLSAVFISALGPAIITQVFPEQERGRALGIISGIFFVGVALGPTVGGLLISLIGWRLIFFLNVPIGLVASLMVALVVPACASSQVKQDFDVLGALIMMVTLTCFALGMTLVQREGFGSLIEPYAFAIAAIGLGCFLLVESRHPQPMLDLGIFRSLELSLGLLLSLMTYVVTASVVFILPFFLELVKQYPAFETGLLLAEGPILAGLMAPVAGTLSDRFGERIISLIGLVLAVFGCLSLSTFDAQLTVPGYILRMAPFVLGVGMFQSPNQSAVMGLVPSERLGIASGLLSLSRTLGQTMGLSLTGVLFSLLIMTRTQAQPNINVTNVPIEALVFGVQMSFRLVALILMAATLLAAFLWWLKQRR